MLYFSSSPPADGCVCRSDWNVVSLLPCYDFWDADGRSAVPPFKPRAAALKRNAQTRRLPSLCRCPRDHAAVASAFALRAAKTAQTADAHASIPLARTAPRRHSPAARRCLAGGFRCHLAILRLARQRRRLPGTAAYHFLLCCQTLAIICDLLLAGVKTGALRYRRYSRGTAFGCRCAFLPSATWLCGLLRCSHAACWAFVLRRNWDVNDCWFGSARWCTMVVVLVFSSAAFGFGLAFAGSVTAGRRIGMPLMP